jgi:hypothetical protein
MLPELLALCEHETKDICILISDCDQRTAWNTESAILMSSSLNELDPFTDHLALGRAFGRTGHASSVLTLAIASAHANAENKPALASSVADPIMRSLAVLQPWQVSPT